MFGKDDEARVRIKLLEQRLSELAETERQLRHLTDDVETLQRKVRALTEGNVTSLFAREVIEKIDKEALKKEVVEMLKAELTKEARDGARDALMDRDFLSGILDEERIEELLVDALVSHAKGTLAVEDIARRVAEEIVENDHLDMGEVEGAVAETLVERMNVTVSLDGKEE